jgi:hypothetical protein
MGRSEFAEPPEFSSSHNNNNNNRRRSVSSGNPMGLYTQEEVGFPASLMSSSSTPTAANQQRRGSTATTSTSNNLARRMSQQQQSSSLGAPLASSGPSRSNTHKLQRTASNAQDVLARFHATQQEYDTQETLKQADRLQQRLAWKEQMERSSALETQIMTNKRTLANLERQLEQLKRELANERSGFDIDLAAKERRLEDAKHSLNNRRKKFDATQQELSDTRSAIARMRAVLVEHFVLTKSYAQKPDAHDPFFDVTGEDYKFYKIYAGAELEKRHQLLIERYIGGSKLAPHQPGERAFAADPLIIGLSGKDIDGNKNSTRYDPVTNKRRISIHDTKRRKSLADSSKADEAAYFSALHHNDENQKPGFSSKRQRGGGDPNDKNKSLNEVRDLLLELEKEMFEAENSVDGKSSPVEVLSPAQEREKRKKAKQQQ